VGPGDFSLAFPLAAGWCSLVQPSADPVSTVMSSFFRAQQFHTRGLITVSEDDGASGWRLG
jgi:hypothetical protein